MRLSSRFTAGVVTAAVIGGLHVTSAQAAARGPLAGQRHSFEVNRGQTDASVRLFSRGHHFALYLTDAGPTFVFNRAGKDAVLTLRVVGQGSAAPIGVGLLDGVSNYLVGSDASQWRTDIPNYSAALYPAVIPGVGLEFHGSEQGELEYDLKLRAGVDPSKLELMLEGASSLSVEADGSLLVHLTGGGVLRKAPPVAYQTAPNGQRSLVAARYQLRGQHSFGFVVGAYDAERELVIDPLLVYASYIGSSSYDEAFAAATDAAGNTYIVGYTTGPLFPVVGSPVQAAYGGNPTDAFVVKLNASGNNFVYSTYLGGNKADQAYAVATDSSGNAYVGGITLSNNFPVASAAQATAGGGQDGFIAKLSPSGSGLLFSTYLGGAQDDFVRGIAVANGSAYATGTTFSSNFPTVAPLRPSLSGTSDAFVSKLSAAGNALVYSTFLGGTLTDDGYAVAVNSAGSAFVVGSTTSTNFPTQGALQATFGGGSTDAFVTKLSPSGGAFTYSTYLGGNFNDEAYGVAVNTLDSPVVTGYTGSTTFPVTSSAEQSARSGATDAFVTRLAINGASFVYSTYLGGSGDERANAVALDSSGTAYLAGETTSTDFPALNALSGQGAAKGSGDAFFAALYSGGTRAYATYYGGSQPDRGVGVGVEGSGSITHFVGNTSSTDLPKLNAAQGALVGSQDAFVLRVPGQPSVSNAPAGNLWTVLLAASALAGGAWFVLRARRTA